MNKIAALSLTLIAVLAAGCDAPSGQTAVAAPRADATSPQKDPPMTDLRPPSADSVLYTIYRHDGDGAVTYQLDSGATVAYWLGHAFELKGKQYFTGFTTKTADAEGPEGDDAGMMEPGAVALGQATFTRVKQGEREVWSNPDTDGFIGQFGSNDQPDPVDTARKVQSQTTQDGRLLLAVPTRSFANGEEARSFAILLFDPDSVDALPYRSWGYLGSVAAGSDNSAACDGGAVMTCASSQGALSFEAADAGGLPAVKVALSGKAVAGPGTLRDLGPADAVTYRFDAKAGRYQP